MAATNKTTSNPQPETVETHEGLASPAPVCIKCKQELPEGAKFCPFCDELPAAKNVEQPRYCLQCNTPFLHAALYKRSPCCGAELKDRPTSWFERSDPKEEAAIDSKFLITQQGKNLLYYFDELVRCEYTLRPIDRARYAGLVLMTERDWYDTLFTRPDLTCSQFAAYCIAGAPNVGGGASSPVSAATRAGLIWFVLTALERRYIDVEGKFCSAACLYFKEKWPLSEERLAVLEFRFDESGKEPLYQFIPKYRDYEAKLRAQWETRKKQPPTSFPCGNCGGSGHERNYPYSHCQTCNGKGTFPVVSSSSFPAASTAFRLETQQQRAVVYCSQCSEKNEPDARFCEVCPGKIFGAHVNNGQPAQASAFNLLLYYASQSYCFCQNCGLPCYGLYYKPYGASGYWPQTPQFCEACGYKLATQSGLDSLSPAYCRKCGERVSTSWKHCVKCGKERTPTLPARVVESSLATRLLPPRALRTQAIWSASSANEENSGDTSEEAVSIDKRPTQPLPVVRSLSVRRKNG